MGSVFALISAVPGKERELLERLASLPGVLQRQLLFGEQIVLRIEEAALASAQQLVALAGVREARLYHGHDAWVLKAKAGAG
jgi:hypothetical protein